MVGGSGHCICQMCVCVNSHIYIYLYMRYVYTYLHTYVRIYIHTYTHTYIYTYIHIHIFMYIRQIFIEQKPLGWLEGVAILSAVVVVVTVASVNDYQKEKQFRKFFLVCVCVQKKLKLVFVIFVSYLCDLYHIF
jgi:hypothetical protein